MNQKRQLNEKEKKEVLEEHGRNCFIDGEPIPEGEVIEFHHIKPYSMGGSTSIDNIAPLCLKHHRAIKTMSLNEYRDKIELEKFFSDGNSKYLDDIFKKKSDMRNESIKYDIDKDIIIYFNDTQNVYPLYTCSTTGWKYFYATLPIQFIRNDKSLQPRALRLNSLWNLYRHFQINTQLAPSICRIDENNNLLLFDGQHKAAAQIWNGRKMIECKVFINPDERSLKETNLEAHGKFRQMTFYSHELMTKYADIFGEDWSQYMEIEGEKSEEEFINFLMNTRQKTRAQARNEISLALYKDIVDNAENKLSTYLSEKNRSRKQPLTFSRLRKTFLQHMLMQPPVKDEFETESDFRNEEKSNLIKLMSVIAKEGLEGKWAPDRKDASHQKAERIFSAGAVRAWTILLKDTINTHLNHYSDEERERFFYTKIKDEDFNYFRNFIKKLFSHKIWEDPDPTGEITARLSKDDASTARSLFEEKGLTVNWLLGNK